MKDNSAYRLSAISVFSEIAHESHQKLVDLELQQKTILSKARPGDNEIELEKKDLQNKIDKCALMVVVFTTMALESYIYDYGARNLTDKFAQDYLDKLDPVSKWVVIPRLVTGKELSRDHRWFELLQNLIKQRNDIIHHKSYSFQVNPKSEEMITFYKKMQKRNEKLLISAKEAIELLELLLIEMKEYDAEEYPWAYAHLAAKSDNPFILLEDL